MKKTGAQTRTGVYLPMSSLLRRMADKIQHEKPITKKRKGRPPRTTRYTDADVLEYRELHEYHGWGIKALSEKSGLSEPTISNIIYYATRPHIVPAKGPRK